MADRPGRRRRAERFGRRAELAAALWLTVTGHRIRARRVKTPVGEIDLIASRGGGLVFVEVKARADTANRDIALSAVNRERIVSAAAWWLAAHPALANRPMRFDVIGLAPFALPRHVRDAFGLSGAKGATWL